MRAGLATLAILDEENLGERAERMGARFRHQLQSALSGYDMVKEVRGMGLLCGIEFRSPHTLPLKVAFEAFRAVHPGVFGQALVSHLFNQHNVLTQICGNNFMVLKVAPPLIVTEEHIDLFVEAVRSTVEHLHSSRSFWAENLALAGRAIRV